MSEDKKSDHNPKFDNIERILTKIKEKLAGREKDKIEYDEINKDLPLLIKEFSDTEKRYTELKNEIGKINKRAIKLYLKTEPSLISRLLKRIQQTWKISKALFFIQLTLLVTLAVLPFSYGNSKLQAIIFESGFTIVILISYVSSPKYRDLTGYFIIAMGLFLLINVLNESLTWTLISLGISMAGLGFASYAFTSGEALEKKFENMETIQNKLDQILKRMPNSSDFKK